MSIYSGQPKVRHNQKGPFSDDGLCYVPKVLTFKKDAISGTSNNDFWVAPTGVFIQIAGMRVVTALDGTPVVTLGTDGNPDALIDATDFDATTIGNSASNIGSATAVGAIGLYLNAGDTIRLAITGSPTVGEVQGFIQYVEMDAMAAEGIHFDIP
jgi:hypothetical protein